MSEPKPDIAAMAKKSRQRACELLGLDPNSLRPADEIFVNRVAVLRVLVADYEAAHLRGERIDVAEYVRASEALEALVRADRRTIAGSLEAEEDARQRMREVLRAVAPEVVAQSDAEDAERLQAQDAEQFDDDAPDEPDEPEDEPQPRSDPPPAPALPPNVIKYHSVKRGPDGRPPAHYLKRDDTFDAPPHWPLPKDYR